MTLYWEDRIYDKPISNCWYDLAASAWLYELYDHDEKYPENCITPREAVTEDYEEDYEEDPDESPYSCIQCGSHAIYIEMDGYKTCENCGSRFF